MQVLPRYFKHNKLGSFSQQLHTYGFRRKSNSSPSDTFIDFYHDQYTGDPAHFLAWVRAGGAQSKRHTSSREFASAPPSGLLHDLQQVEDGTRQLAVLFHQAKATHAMQLRTILMKLMLRGVLSPDNASYISTLPPITPMLPLGGVGAPAMYNAPPRRATATAPRQGGNGAGSSSWFDSQLTVGGQQGAPAPSGGQTVESLQLQLDTLEAGLAPLANQALGSVAASDKRSASGSVDSSDIQGDEALNLFVDSAAPARPPSADALPS